MTCIGQIKTHQFWCSVDLNNFGTLPNADDIQMIAAITNAVPKIRFTCDAFASGFSIIFNAETSNLSPGKQRTVIANCAIIIIILL
jgi:hypothetical protein